MASLVSVLAFAHAVPRAAAAPCVRSHASALRVRRLAPVVAQQLPPPPAAANASDPQKRRAGSRALADLVDTQRGSVPGAIALVAGTTVGAGIIALPAKTLAAGFVPSAVALFGSWLYMASTGLLIAEVNINTLCAVERSAVSLPSMAEQTLGPIGAKASSAAFIFLHVCLLCAYILQGGTLLLEVVQSPLPPAVGTAAFTTVLGAALVLLSQARLSKYSTR